MEEERKAANASASLKQQESCESLVERYKTLHDLLAGSYFSYSSHAKAYLEAGMRFFQADAALLCKLRILTGELLVEHQIGSFFQEGELVNPHSEWCDFTITEKKVKCVNDSDGISGSMSYNGLPIRAYVCAPLVVSGQIYGVLCFLNDQNNTRSLTHDDVATVELMAKGVAKMIELHKKTAEGQSRYQSGFATEGVKTFEEYVEQARLPEAYGVPGRVVEVLQRRIGNSPLSIDHVADEMNLSKRTLQRRLQQQEISFAQLRDQVRFHHSINYLVENVMSIDSISSSLDFSDRTSFTNAFKRWTGLSPSTFRKLFRDYA